MNLRTIADKSGNRNTLVLRSRFNNRLWLITPSSIKDMYLVVTEYLDRGHTPVVKYMSIHQISDQFELTHLELEEIKNLKKGYFKDCLTRDNNPA